MFVLLVSIFSCDGFVGGGNVPELQFRNRMRARAGATVLHPETPSLKTADRRLERSYIFLQSVRPALGSLNFDLLFNPVF